MSVVAATRRGRPLRFLAVTLGGWTTARVAMLWPASVAPIEAMGPAATAVDPAPPPTIAVLEAPAPRPIVAVPVSGSRRPAMPSPAADRAATPSPVPSPEHVIALDAAVGSGAGSAAPAQILPPPFAPTPLAVAPARLAGSAWLLARGGTGGTLLGGRLGASQAGMRLTYALGEARRVALSARIATPLAGSGREGGVGIDWQPTRLPLHLLAEQRFSLDGGRGGPAVLVVGGINPTPVAAGFRLEGYAEAGAIKRDRVEAFGDGAVRLTRPVVAVGRARIDLGVGAWGAGQRDARRLDVGPTIGAILPVATRALRLTADWRERIAGDASPGSGPALSIGVDF